MPSANAEDAPVLAGRYRVIRQLGHGGMAGVLLAEDERLGRQVAIKRLHTSSPEDALARFRREARIGASLNHPNVVSIFDSTTDEDSLLIVMEYVDGESLKEVLAGGPLEPERAVEVLTQIGAALDHAHAAGIVHRDVKPSNVLIGTDGIAKLADLGIATAVDATRITSTNDIIGTLSYIAPERLENAPDAASADIYSLAAVAFETLSGEKAQRGRTPTEIVTAGGPSDLRDVWPAAPGGAAEALADGLARDPRRRPESAGELIRRLSAGLRNTNAQAIPDPEATLPLAAPTLPPTETAAGDATPAYAAAPASMPAPSPSRRGRFALLAALAAAIGIAVAIIAIGSDDGGTKRAASGRATPQTNPQTSESTQPKSTTTNEPAPLTDEALGAELNDQGKALIDSGSYSAAIPILQRAVNAFPDGSTDLNYAYALFNLGQALRLAGHPEEAIPVLEQRLEIPNQTSVVAQELALAQQEAGVEASGGAGAPGPKPKKSKKPKEPKPPKEPDEDSSGPGPSEDSSGGIGPG